jgi:hypothetical protein
MIFDFVAIGGPSDSFRVVFFRVVSTDDRYVGGLFLFRDFVLENEKTGLGTAGQGRIGTKTLEHTSNFFRIGRLPFQSFAAFAEDFVFGDHSTFQMHGGTMHGQILDEVGGGVIGGGHFADTWAASFGGLGAAGLAAKALGTLAGGLVVGGVDGGCSFNVGDLRGGLAKWRWGLGRFDGFLEFVLLFATAGASESSGFGIG